MITHLPENSFKLVDRTALLYGPLGTTTQAIAIKLTQLGCNVALLVPPDSSGDGSAGRADHVQLRATKLAEHINDSREGNEKLGRGLGLVGNPDSPAAATELVGRVAESFGGVDVLIDARLTHRAAAFRTPEALEPGPASSPHVLLHSSLCLVQASLRFLEAKRRGRAIFLMSEIDRQGRGGNPWMAAARGALGPLARSLSRQFAEVQLGATLLSVGVTEEYLLNEFPQSSSLQLALTELKKQFPSAKIADMDRVATAVAFLASPLGLGFAGESIAVDSISI